MSKFKVVVLASNVTQARRCPADTLLGNSQLRAGTGSLLFDALRANVVVFESEFSGDTSACEPF